MVGVILAEGKVTRGFDSFASSLREGVESRLRGKTASDATRQVFSAKDHAAKKYTRNPRLWCADLVPQLTGCAVWKPPLEYAGERYGGVMITRRHILFCKHSHPAWDGGWMKVQPQIIRFVTKDNKVVDMKLIANADSPDSDLCVGLLHEEVPAGIHVAPLTPALSVAQKQRLLESNIPDIAVSQSGKRPSGVSHESVVYPGPPSLLAASPSDPLAPWRHAVYEGDSGTPRFYLTSEGLALAGLTGAADLSGKAIALKGLIEACDDSAIARGVIKKRTGLVPAEAKVAVPAG